MYQQPFGSIFGETPLKKPALPAESEKEAPAATSEEENKKILEARQAVQYEELRKPKIPFSREEPQFRAASTVVSDDPQVLLLQSKLSLEKSQIKYATLHREYTELKDKVTSAEVYLSVLNELEQLPESKQKEIYNFIEKNAEKLRATSDSKKMIGAAKDIKEATAALNAEIKHWEELDARKGKVTLKAFRPTSTKVSEELPKVKLLPKLGGKAPSVVRLDKAGIAKFAGYGEEVLSSKPKADEFYIKYMSKLPDQGIFVKQREAGFKGGKLRKETEKNVLMAQQYDWKADDLAKKMSPLSEKLAALQASITKKSAGFKNQEALIGLSIAVNRKPQVFRTGMLLDGLRTALKDAPVLEGLGEEAQVVKSGEAELATREKVLTNLQANVISTPVVEKPSIKWPALLIGVAVLCLLLGGR